MLMLEPATLTPLLKWLESAGFSIRQRDKADERPLAIDLTDRGLALRADCEQVPQLFRLDRVSESGTFCAT